MAPHLIGRDDDVAALFAVLDSGPKGQIAIISGSLGSGKTALLEMAAHRADEHGIRVLRIAGSPEESATDFAGLYQLRDVLGDIEPVAGSTEPAEVARALLGRLDAMPPERAFLFCIDDVQWLDEPSRTALLFAARRWSGRPLTVVLTLPESGRLPGLSGHGPVEVALRPLSRGDAAALLDLQPNPPHGLLREQILTQAAGNPAALIGFAAAAADGARRGLALEPLPLPPGRHADYAWRVARLPAATRQALVTIAAASAEDLRALIPSAVMDLDALAPAEVAGLLHVDSDRIGFIDPLIRSVTYYRVPLAARLEAHRRLAGALTALPDRQVWHAAHAALAPDDDLAARLETTRPVVLERDGQAAAAAVMQRAAELTQDRAERTRRLLEAAGLARRTEDLGWAADLSRQALLSASTDSERVRARTELGWALSWRDDGDSAIGTLLGAAEMALRDNPQLAWSPLRAAASLAFFTDESDQHDAVLRALRDLVTLERADADTMTDQRAADAVASLLWIRAAINPQLAHLNSDEVKAMVQRAADPLQLGGLAGAAWLGGQPDLAIGCLRSAWAAGAAVRGLNSGAVSWIVLAGACIDSGRWDEALRAATELVAIGGSGGQFLVAGVGELVTATVAARRGNTAVAQQRVSAAQQLIDPKDNRAVAAWSAHVLGQAALAGGDGLAAYSHLRALFTESGVPLHRYLSYLALADYAEAAVQAGRTEQFRAQLPAIVNLLPHPHSPRVEQLIAHASGAVARDAGDIYRRALADEAGERWPFERARLRIGYAAWLRRQRRRNDAQEQLVAALTILEQLRAEPWIELCTRELRAAGARSTTAPESATAKLSPQEHQVVYLVSQGLTNPQIAARLHLSARTVSGHLYRSFPKLGVTSRNQIRDIEPPPDFHSG